MFSASQASNERQKVTKDFTQTSSSELIEKGMSRQANCCHIADSKTYYRGFLSSSCQANWLTAPRVSNVREGGKTVGQAFNFVYEPYKRANPEDAAAAASDEPAAPATGEAINGDAAAAVAEVPDGQALQDAATATGADAGTAMTETAAGAAATDGSEADAAAANRTSFNMILYGLPNILVTLIDK
ncbi:hypothetical protein BOX15_Mlig031669g1 [Macrostomum lignano]|uniref:Uncharacterized protein n=1 Tax=Macrostomum lignano TaxID=282301 RepID=A0A267E0T2_9PLAT|nr:hypothetical protein BOX15_Mlig031669g1 [Macrostomum lignano]